MKDTEKQAMLRKTLTEKINVVICTLPKKERIAYRQALKGLSIEHLLIYKDAILKLNQNNLKPF
jgi:hypothetical protein